MKIKEQLFVGQKINKWTIVDLPKNKNNVYVCQCECGKKSTFNSYSLQSKKPFHCRTCAAKKRWEKTNNKNTSPIINDIKNNNTLLLILCVITILNILLAVGILILLF